MVSERGKLEQLMADPAAFREALLVDADGEPKRFGPNLDDWQREDFEAIDSGLRRVVGQPVENPTLRAMFIRPRGHSKTSDQAVSASWLLFASRRKLNGIAAAADKDQAALLLNSIDSLCRLNPWLGSILEVGRDRVVNKRSGSVLTAITSDAASSFGHLIDFCVLDEITHWRGRELFDSLLSAAAKRANCLVLGIANAGFRESWSGKVVDQIRTDSAWLFRELNGPKASWITPERLEEQRRLLPPKTFARLWENCWSDGSGDALDGADIQAAVTLSGPCNYPERGWAYVAGLDIGLKRDATALAVVAKHTGFMERHVRKPRKLVGAFGAMADLGFIDAPQDEVKYTRHAGSGQLKLVELHVWKPSEGRVELDAIEHVIRDVHRRYNLTRMAFDPYQAEYLGQRLGKAGVYCESMPFTPSTLQSMASGLLTAFRERQLSLYDHPELIADLKAMRITEKANGAYRLEMARGNEDGTSHGDAATALAIALEASRAIRSDSTLHANRRLVYN